MSTRPATGAAARTRTARAPRTSTAPIQLRKRPTAWADPDRLPLFTIDDVEYSMPRVVHQGDVMKWTPVLNAIVDDDAKAIMLLRLLCGNEAANALLDEAELTKGEWRNLKEKMRLHAFGPTEREDTEGN